MVPVWKSTAAALPFSRFHGTDGSGKGHCMTTRRVGKEIREVAGRQLPL
jgi:hypothetical protein